MSTPLGLNASLASALAAGGRRLDPYLAINFLVELDGLVVGGFSRVEGLESSIQTEDYVEGGRNDYVHKVMKGTTYPPLVLSHGLTDVDSLWAWHERTRRGVIERKNGTIMLLDAERRPVMWWTFTGALPVRWVGPTFDAGQDAQVAIERVDLVHRGITKPPESRAAAPLRLGGKAR